MWAAKIQRECAAVRRDNRRSNNKYADKEMVRSGGGAGREADGA